jgi:hypothetical protein
MTRSGKGRKTRGGNPAKEDARDSAARRRDQDAQTPQPFPPRPHKGLLWASTLLFGLWLIFLVAMALRG